MARVTIEDCTRVVNNRFTLVHAAVKRARQLMKGSKPTIGETKNREVVTALREIAAEKVHVTFQEDKERSQPVVSEIAEIKELKNGIKLESLEASLPEQNESEGEAKKEEKSEKSGKSDKETE